MSEEVLYILWQSKIRDYGIYNISFLLGSVSCHWMYMVGL